MHSVNLSQDLFDDTKLIYSLSYHSIKVLYMKSCYFLVFRVQICDRCSLSYITSIVYANEWYILHNTVPSTPFVTHQLTVIPTTFEFLMVAKSSPYFQNN